MCRGNSPNGTRYLERLKNWDWLPHLAKNAQQNDARRVPVPLLFNSLGERQNSPEDASVRRQCEPLFATGRDLRQDREVVARFSSGASGMKLLKMPGRLSSTTSSVTLQRLNHDQKFNLSDLCSHRPADSSRMQIRWFVHADGQQLRIAILRPAMGRRLGQSTQSFSGKMSADGITEISRRGIRRTLNPRCSLPGPPTIQRSATVYGLHPRKLRCAKACDFPQSQPETSVRDCVLAVRLRGHESLADASGYE